MIFQFYHLLPELNAVENVLVPRMIRHGVFSYWRHRRAYVERARELLELVGLSHRLTHKPNQLSGGEMQRVAIARALISEPDLLLADEPTGNLDTDSGREVIESLLKLKRQHNVTIAMVTHDENIAAIADRVVALVDGRIQVRR
jgi:lipoprotein-releasing system ATP-binding protein